MSSQAPGHPSEDFILTDAVRPHFQKNGGITPMEGYRRGIFTIPETGATIPVLCIAASREKVFNVFLDLLHQLPEELNIIVECTDDVGRITTYVRRSIHRQFLETTLCEFEPALVNDGFTGIAIWPDEDPLRELQFDEHKELFVYNNDLHSFEQIVQTHGVPYLPILKLISEGGHSHQTHDGLHARIMKFIERIDAQHELSP